MIQLETVMLERYKIIKNGKRLEGVGIDQITTDLGDGRIVLDYPRGLLFLGGYGLDPTPLGRTQNEMMKCLLLHPDWTVFPNKVVCDISGDSLTSGSFRVVSHRLNRILVGHGYPKMIKIGSPGAPGVTESGSRGRYIDRGSIDLYLIAEA